MSLKYKIAIFVFERAPNVIFSTLNEFVGRRLRIRAIFTPKSSMKLSRGPLIVTSKFDSSGLRLGFFQYCCITVYLNSRYK